MGQIQLIRAYRMESGYRMGPCERGENELLWQIRRAVPVPWASSGIFIELMIHQIDECCWIKDAWPVAAHGVGGRVADSTDCSQNLDSYSIEYTFADGTKAMVTGRYIPKCHNDFATYVHGTKCAAQFSGNIHAPTVAHLQGPADRRRQHRLEAETRAGQSLAGRVERAAGRHPQRPAAQRGPAGGLLEPGRDHGPGGRPHGQDHHLGRAMASKFQFCPNVASLTTDSPAPVQADAKGRYPAPIPGAWTEI